MGLQIGLSLSSLIAASGGGPAPSAPVIVTPGSIDEQPLVGQSILLTEPDVTGAIGSPAYQWFKDPGTWADPISGATSASFTPTATEYALTDPIGRQATYTNATGDTVEYLTAPDVVGYQAVEDFGNFTIGDDTADMLAAGWSRFTSSASASSWEGAIVASDDGISGNALSFPAANPSVYAAFRSDWDTFFGANGWKTRYQEMYAFTLTGLTGRHAFRNRMSDPVLSVATTDFSGGLNLRLGVPSLAAPATDPNNTGTLGTLSALTAGTLYIARLEFEGVNLKLKLWAATDPEPASWSATGAHSVNVVGRGPAFFNRVFGDEVEVAWVSCAGDADAPFWPGYIPPVEEFADTLDFTAGSSKALVTEFGGDVALNFSGTETAGTYVGGRNWVTIDGSVTITSTTPASAEVSGDWQNGMELADLALLTEDLPTFIGPRRQGFDERVLSGGGGTITYDPTLNVDPGAVGSALVITTPGTLVKAVSRPPPSSGRGILASKSAFHFIDHTPTTDSLPPPIGSSPHVSRYLRTDIDFDLLPGLTPPIYMPSPEGLFARYRWLKSAQLTGRPGGDWYTSAISEYYYGTLSAQEMASMALCMCYDLSAISARLNEDIAIQMVIFAQDVLEAAKSGAVYNFNEGLGGVLPGYKLPMVLAGLLTDDAEMLEWADPDQHDIWAEDRQTVYVSADDVTNFDYISDDLGMPEWMQNPVKDPGANGRALSGLINGNNNYRGTFTGHQFGQAAVLHMFPGAVTAWNHPAFFDYCERIARNTAYLDPGSDMAWAFLDTSKAYPPPNFHKQAYLDNVAAGWTWPP